MTAKNIINNVSRRNLIKFGAATLGTSVVTAGIGSKLLFPEPAEAYNNITPDAALKLVMGHQKCGAVDATIKGAQVPGQIASLLDAIKPGLANIDPKKANQLEAAIKANVRYQVGKIQESPVIAQLVEDGKLKIVGSYFDFNSGKISLVS
jgi:carbonic anhydrase